MVPLLFSAHINYIITTTHAIDIAEEILNRCTELDPECYVYKEEFKVIFDYEFIEDNDELITNGLGKGRCGKQARYLIKDVETQIECLTIENSDVINSQTGDTTNRYK